MDGVTGIYSPGDKELIQKIALATGALQGRGRYSSGIAVAHANGIDLHSDIGVIGDVLEPELLATYRHLQPVAAIGNVGYPKGKHPSKADAEPLRIRPKKPGLEVVVTMDGSFIHLDEIRTELEADYYFRTHSPTEVIGAMLHRSISTKGITEDAGREFSAKLSGRGTFAMTALVHSDGKNYLIAINDSKAFEPFCYGAINGSSTLVASSESCSHRRLGGHISGEFNGAQMIIASENGSEIFTLANEVMMPDVFQAVYFGYPASLFRGKEISLVREALGISLVQRYGVPMDDKLIVIPNPDSGWGVTMGMVKAMSSALWESAFDYSREAEGILTIKNRKAYELLRNRLSTVQPALIKNPASVRTFQEGGNREVQLLLTGFKFGTIDRLVDGADVNMGDDSIVKGTVGEGGSIWSLHNSNAASIRFWVSYGPMFFPSFKEWYKGRECLEALAVQRAFKGDNPYDKTLEQINAAVARLVHVDEVRYNAPKDVMAATGQGSAMAMDASYPIAERFWPSWLRKEVELFNRYRK